MKTKEESAGRIFRKNLQQHLATESGSDSDDGDNQFDLVQQAIIRKKRTKKGKCKLVKLNLSKQRHAIILFIRYPRKLQDSKLNWFPFRNKKKKKEKWKIFLKFLSMTLNSNYFFSYVDDNLTDVLFIVLKQIIVLKEIIKYGVKSLNQLRLNERLNCLKWRVAGTRLNCQLTIVKILTN